MINIKELEKLMFKFKYRTGAKELYYAEKRRCKRNPFHNAMEIISNLREGSQVHLITGFPVSCGKYGETDGPLGTIVLSELLRDLNFEPIIISDEYLIKPMEAIIKQFNLGIKIQSADRWNHTKTSLFITIERPGHAYDNNYYSMKGKKLDNIYPFDSIIEKSFDTTPIIAIGDGGNEIGMGNIYETIKKYVPLGKKIGSVVKSHVLIVSQVSNWGAYTLDLVIRDHMNIEQKHTPMREKAYLETLNEFGVVDGITCKANATVDGLPLKIHMDYIKELNKLRI